MIMRYQRISPDSLPLGNGRRSSSISNSNWKTSKEEEDRGEINGNVTIKSSSAFEGKGLSRFRSPSRTSQEHHIGNGNGNGVIGVEVPNSPPTTSATATRNHQNLESNGVVGGGGDTFLQWGHRKRSRCSRGMALTDDTSSSTSSLQLQSTKLQRRSSVPNSSSPNGNLMPPPSLAANGIAGGLIIKPQNKTLSSNPSAVRRNLDERSAGGGNKSPPPSNIGGGGGSSSRAVSSRSRAGKRSPSLDKKNPSSVSTRDEKMNGCSLRQRQQNQEAVTSDVNNIVYPPQQGGCSSMNDDNHANDNNAARSAKLGGGGGGLGKVNGGGGSGEVNEWPRIYIPLSRKEKEEDFLAMKGTKLPHRPKKRPKTVERTLQYCFPGLWLPELTRGRYEVREKKCPRKPKRRGLKGMESMETDSE